MIGAVGVIMPVGVVVGRDEDNVEVRDTPLVAVGARSRYALVLEELLEDGSHLERLPG